MSKFYGTIGFAKYEETDPEYRPGVFEETVTEKKYYGDILSSYKKFQNGDNLNDNLTISNRISILADPYVTDNLQWIRYIVIQGIKWKVENVEIQYPRLILSVGGVYNGKEES